MEKVMSDTGAPMLYLKRNIGDSIICSVDNKGREIVSLNNLQEFGITKIAGIIY